VLDLKTANIDICVSGLFQHVCHNMLCWTSQLHINARSPEVKLISRII